MTCLLLALSVCLLWALTADAWSIKPPLAATRFSTTRCAAVQEKPTTTTSPTASTTTTNDTVEETTKKFGLEVGLWESLQQKDGGASAKSLLKRYGIAYLATSIPLAMISFAVCYILVDQGVDVAGLLRRVGVVDSGVTETTAGTLALAYAAHKAASPLRFPPTVLLTPVVAKLLGKEPAPPEVEE
jgi:hypothetical protein